MLKLTSSFFIPADSIPHDTSVAAAMLIFVIFNVHPGSSFQSESSASVEWESSLSSRLQCWFSYLRPFAQLTICHGVLAKLPPSLLLTAEMEERPLLVALFPRICKLFDRSVRGSSRNSILHKGALCQDLAPDVEGVGAMVLCPNCGGGGDLKI